MIKFMPLAAAALGIALLTGPVATPASATTHTDASAAVHEAGVKVKKFSRRGFGRRGGFGVKKFGFNRFGGKKLFIAPNHSRRFGRGPAVKKFFGPFNPNVIVIK